MTRRQRRAQFEALQARVERLVNELSFAWHHVAQRQLAFEKLRAECDEARARVRSIANWPLGNAAMSERILSAREIVARWDEEEKR